MRLHPLAAAVILASACTNTVVHPPPPIYRPPAPLQPIGFELQTSRGFDATWDALVDYASRASFSIDEFERDSGLMTLSYSSSNPSELVDCGTWQQGGKTVDYLARTPFQLRTKANLLVRNRGGQETLLRVNMFYDLQDDHGNGYRFTTNESATVAPQNRARGSSATRTCQSTHVAETKFLQGVRDALR